MLIPNKSPYWGLTHIIMEAEKPQALQAASWRPRRDNVNVPVWKLVGLRPKKSQGFSLSPKAEKDEISQLTQSHRRSLLLPRLFVLSGSPVDRLSPPPPPLWEGTLLYSVPTQV